MRRRRTVLMTLFLQACLIGSTVLWLRAKQRQYVLSRQLIVALDRNDYNQALALVNLGADPNTPCTPPPPPTFAQIWNRLLHRYHPPVDDGLTALLIVCGAGWIHPRTKPDTEWPEWYDLDDANLVEVMLNHGGYVNDIDAYGTTALMSAAYMDHPKIVRVLLDHGANPNLRGMVGTALNYHMQQGGNPETVKLLLAHGVNPNIADEYGRTPLRMAELHNYPAVESLLRQSGVKE